MQKAEKGAYTEYDSYRFSSTSFRMKDKIGGQPLPAKRRRR